jgi:hypothetical protein
MIRRRRISGLDLSWMIFDRMRSEISRQRGVSVAVVPDVKLGWRAVLDSRSTKFLGPVAVRKLRSIENELRSEYALAKD